MSFRARLTLFFVLIVIVPMASLTFVLFRLIADNEQGKADAGLAARQEVAIATVREERRRGDAGAVAVGSDVRLATALRARNAAAARRRATALLDEQQLKRIVVTRDGRTAVDVGARAATFPAARRLTDAGGATFGVLQVSASGPTAFARALRARVGLDVVVSGPDGALATTLPGAGSARLPALRGDVTVEGRRLRAVSFATPAFGSARTRVTLLAPVAGTLRQVRESRLLAAGILLGFFVLAFTFALLVSRSLQRQIGGFLEAARRLGRGDFSERVPTVGRDEFAALGDEFNRMSAQLDERMRELTAERGRLADAMRRIGDTFASNLDRDALLQIVVASAIDGTGASAGRSSVRDGPGRALVEATRVGEVEALEGLLAAAEAAALRGAADPQASSDEGHALAHALRAHRTGGQEGTPVRGVVSVARTDRPFDRGEIDLFHYLTGQASVSVENVGLHEAVERQAVTDALTGLANRRRFEDVLTREVERSRRFDEQVSLILLDIDDFKVVNDTHGHQVGDEVLRAVAEVLRDSGRELDEAARYGGEELAVVLPGTDLTGAVNLGERVREGIAAIVVPVGDVEVRVTASIGAATRPGSGDDIESLIEAADAALYEAKRAGKDRVVAAPAGSIHR